MMAATAENRRKRSAMTLVEAAVAAAIAAAVLAGVAQMLVLLARQSQITQRRTAAVREAGNLMERLMSRPWSELTKSNAASLSLSPSCRRLLPDPRLRVDVADETDEAAPARRITIEIDWVNRAGQRGRPVRLVAWRFPIEEAAP